MVRSLALAVCLSTAVHAAEPAATAPAATAPAASTVAKAAVVLSEDGGLDAVTLRTVRGLLAGKLRQRGLGIVEDPRLDDLRPADAETARIAREAGGDRLFSLRIGRLGTKLLFTLDEVEPTSQRVVQSATLNAVGVEEGDKILPRLVDAVLDRTPVGETARYATVVHDETRLPVKKQGEYLLAFGLPFALGASARDNFGFSLGLYYELEHVRIGGTIGGNHNIDDASRSAGSFLMGMDAAWLPLDGEVTPYLGGGLGYSYLGTGTGSGSGLAATAEVGVEALRLHNMRVMVGLQALLPFYEQRGEDSWNPVTNRPVPGQNGWSGAFLLNLRLAL